MGDNCVVVIVAGCGIDNCGPKDSEHDGITDSLSERILKLSMLKSITVQVMEREREFLIL